MWLDNGDCGVRMELVGKYKGDRKNMWVDYEWLEKEKGVIMKIVGMVRINYMFDKKKWRVYEGDELLG